MLSKVKCSQTRAILLGLALVGTTQMVSAAEVANIIVKSKPDNAQMQQMHSGKAGVMAVRTQQMQPLSVALVSQLSADAGAKVVDLRGIGTGAHVVHVDVTGGNALQASLAKIQADKAVQYAVVDQKMYPTAVAEPSFNSVMQWDMLQSSGDNFSGLYTFLSQQNMVPGKGVIVAVIDTGYTPHPNFLSNLEKVDTSNYGYQFISDCRVAGSCPSTTPDESAAIIPQANGLDLGDFITSLENESGFFQGCVASSSSWHGSHVTGTIIAQGYDTTNPDKKILGGAYGAHVLPLRALGKCGGYTSDIINAMIWGAGGHVYGVTDNKTPAQVLSLSLGSTGACSDAYQDAIDQINSLGAVAVIAAGNSRENVINANPANCKDVISVAAKGATNVLAYYSNHGNTTITASGGDAIVGPAVYSTIWNSTQQFVESNGPTFASYQGTSMATPHVSAAVADIVGYYLTLPAASRPTYNVDTITKLLQNSAVRDNNYSACNDVGFDILGNLAILPTVCVTSGALDAQKLVQFAMRNVTLTANPKSVTLTQINSPATITLTNHESETVTVSQVAFASATSNFFISPQSTCVTNGSLAAAGTCTIAVSATTGTLAGQSAVINVMAKFNGGDAALATTVNVQYQPATGGSSSGGCSAVAHGDDYGLLILLGLVMAALYYRRKQIHKQRV